MKEGFITAVKKMKREQWLIGIIVGVLLLVIAMPTEKKDTPTTSEQSNTQQEGKSEMTSIREEYEQQLTKALSLVEGVGSVQVAVTMESSGSKIVEKDKPTDTESSTQTGVSGTQSSSQSSSVQETTVYEELENGSQTPYISSEIYPEVRGVLVVAQGGDNPVVVQQIQEAVIALFHIDAHNIKVLKMK